MIYEEGDISSEIHEKDVTLRYNQGRTTGSNKNYSKRLVTRGEIALGLKYNETIVEFKVLFGYRFQNRRASGLVYVRPFVVIGNNTYYGEEKTNDVSLYKYVYQSVEITNSDDWKDSDIITGIEVKADRGTSYRVYLGRIYLKIQYVVR